MQYHLEFIASIESAVFDVVGFYLVVCFTMSRLVTESALFLILRCQVSCFLAAVTNGWGWWMFSFDWLQSFSSLDGFWLISSSFRPNSGCACEGLYVSLHVRRNCSSDLEHLCWPARSDALSDSSLRPPMMQDTAWVPSISQAVNFAIFS